MQVLKFLLTVCAVVVCASRLSVCAQDNPAQAAARAALLDVMNGSNAPAAQTNGAPILIDSSGVVSQPTNQITTPVPAPAEAAPAAQPPVTAAPPLDAEAQARARAALLQQMGQPPGTTPVPAPMVPMQPTMPAMKPMAPMAVTPTQPTMPAMKPMTVVANPPGTTQATFAGNEPGFTPIVAPPLPISAAKQQQLAALLAQYEADQISPEEYHKQRAAILAGP